jgi:hypothetical protein
MLRQGTELDLQILLGCQIFSSPFQTNKRSHRQTDYITLLCTLVESNGSSLALLSTLVESCGSSLPLLSTLVESCGSSLPLLSTLVETSGSSLPQSI